MKSTTLLVAFGAESHRKRRHGSTLLDVAMGASLLSLLLIPSMHLISQSQNNLDRSRIRERLLLEADRLMRTRTVELRDRKALDDAFRSPREELIKLNVENASGCVARTAVYPEPTVGTAATPLVTIVVDVWQDRNGDQRMDKNEVSQSLRTHQGQW
jgi:hypothetical protein